LKLLFDQNLSPKLAVRLADLFPGSSHVLSLGLDRASDDAIWDHARDQNYAIVTKDADYNNLGVV
jgi:predicted nuclease of predicted toxin-antitoxin system